VNDFLVGPNRHRYAGNAFFPFVSTVAYLIQIVDDDLVGGSFGSTFRFFLGAFFEAMGASGGNVGSWRTAY